MEPARTVHRRWKLFSAGVWACAAENRGAERRRFSYAVSPFTRMAREVCRFVEECGSGDGEFRAGGNARTAEEISDASRRGRGRDSAAGPPAIVRLDRRQGKIGCFRCFVTY